MTAEQQYYESEVFWNSSLLQDDRNQERLRRTEAMIPQDVRSLIDAGCGNGIFAHHLMKARPEIAVTCLDRSEKALSFVRANKLRGSIEDIPLPDGSFECVTCLEVIEHLPYGTYEKALQELMRVSSRYVLITVPHAENLAQNTTECPKCGTRFNADLHLRSFDRERMQTLLPGLRPLRTEVFVPFERYVGAEMYYRYLAGKVFNSPICPVCSWTNPKFSEKAAHEVSSFEGGGRLAGVKSLVKTFWPKRTHPGFWIACLYERA